MATSSPAQMALFAIERGTLHQAVYWAVKMISKKSGIDSRIGNDRKAGK
jgi:hypothetical protein